MEVLLSRFFGFPPGYGRGSRMSSSTRLRAEKGSAKPSALKLSESQRREGRERSSSRRGLPGRRRIGYIGGSASSPGRQTCTVTLQKAHDSGGGVHRSSREHPSRAKVDLSAANELRVASQDPRACQRVRELRWQATRRWTQSATRYASTTRVSMLSVVALLAWPSSQGRHVARHEA